MLNKEEAVHLLLRVANESEHPAMQLSTSDIEKLRVLAHQIDYGVIEK